MRDQWNKFKNLFWEKSEESAFLESQIADCDTKPKNESYEVKILNLRIKKLESQVQNLKETSESHKKLNGKLRRELRRESLTVKKWEILLKDIKEERDASKRN